MINLSNITAGLVAGLVITSVVPALAGNRTIHRGFDARAQATEDNAGDSLVSPDRARALRDCNGQVDGLREYTWGVRKSDVYRSCMAGYGQVE